MPESGYQSIIYEKKPPIAYITLNRPEKFNALNTGPGAIIDELDQAITDLQNDDDIKVFVVKANGPHFSGGYDISPRGESYFVSSSAFINASFSKDPALLIPSATIYTLV